MPPAPTPGQATTESTPWTQPLLIRLRLDISTVDFVTMLNDTARKIILDSGPQVRTGVAA
ncbi:hypothetical protein GCM10029978_095040 [Actinoallomurus acanthiterrae]